jgi:hypothetical protein
MGVANLESSTKKRTAFIDKVKGLVDKLFTYASPDMAADQVRQFFLYPHDAQSDELIGCRGTVASDIWAPNPNR